MSYPINAPVDFVNTNNGDTINFEANGPTIGTGNAILNFVTTSVGDMLFRATGGSNVLERLPLGTSGQVLSSNGTVPVWTTPVSGATVFTAYITNTVAGIPTSRTGGANPGSWFPLNNTYVTWSTSSPGLVDGSVFNTDTGVFTAPTDGVYSFDALVTFDSGSGVNAGTGLPAASLPSGTAVRQLQLYSPVFQGGAATVLATDVKQVSASNSNCTVCELTSVTVSLNASDTVELRARHDRTLTNTVTIGDPAIVLPNQNYFSARRVR